MVSHKEIHLALRAILVTVVGLPAARVWENAFQNNGQPYVPVKGTPYVDESYAPSANTLLTTGAAGTMEARGLYFVNWYGITGAGIHAIRDGVDAVLAAFPAGRGFPMTSGLTLRIRGDQAPLPGQITALDNGFSFCQIRIPWVVYSYNA